MPTKIITTPIINVTTSQSFIETNELITNLNTGYFDIDVFDSAFFDNEKNMFSHIIVSPISNVTSSEQFTEVNDLTNLQVKTKIINNIGGT